MIGSPAERTTREALVRYAHRVYDKGWVANHDGNLTARIGSGRIAATPTAFSKAQVQRDDLVVVDEKGKQIAGKRRVFSEIELHVAIYDARPDAKAIVHAHPPYATAMAVSGAALDTPFMAEAVVSLGPVIPTLEFSAPKTAALRKRVREYATVYDAMILAGHGVIACGDDVEQAFLRVELVEHLARIATHARAWGGPKPLPADVLPELLDARTRAGLGPQARGVAVPAELRASPPRSSSVPPSASLPSTSSPTPTAVGTDELTQVIFEELRAILRARG